MELSVFKISKMPVNGIVCTSVIGKFFCIVLCLLRELYHYTKLKCLIVILYTLHTWHVTVLYNLTVV